jgi:hypothetical protein
MPKPLPRLPSYDPEAGDSPTGSATFVICVDGDENVSLLVNRQAYAKSNGVRRVAYAFSSVLVVTRSWMLPEARHSHTRDSKHNMHQSRQRERKFGVQRQRRLVCDLPVADECSSFQSRRRCAEYVEVLK